MKRVNARSFLLKHDYLENLKFKKLILRDPEAGISKAVDLYGGAVKTICQNILSEYPAEDIEEAIAQSFAELWRSMPNYSPSRGSSVKSWLYGIARKTALMHRRQKPLYESISPEDAITGTDPAAEEDFLSKEDERILHLTIEEMDEPARSIFILRYFYFEKVAEIARRLELPCKKVENILFREKAKLRRILTERGIER